MNRLTALALAALCFGLASHAAEAGAKLGVLLVTGGHGFQKEPFLQVFRDNSGISFTHVAHTQGTSDAYDHAELANCDVVVLYDMVQNITAGQKINFLGLFKRGTGLVVLHHALVSYQGWPEFARIVGGTYPEDQTRKGQVTAQLGYEHDVAVPVVIVTTNHPVTAGLRDFLIHDEIYWGFQTRPDVTPLITTTQPKSGKPLAWCREEGLSRVVYLQLGHDSSAYTNANYRQLLAQSIRWTARK
jgi:type 1 glutamine amidotransferase